ncbi:MAG: YkgJ family cysteine cluster protein [Candidatus Bathyarchaeia archaeon]
MAVSYPPGIRFLCNRCTICCRNTTTRVRRILLLEQEVLEISEVTSRAISTFAEPSREDSRFPYEMKKIKGRCSFLVGDSCTIYEYRPLICRFYPFSLRRFGGVYYFHPTKECPAIGDGEELEKGFFENLLRLALKKFGEL